MLLVLRLRLLHGWRGGLAPSEDREGALERLLGRPQLRGAARRHSRAPRERQPRELRAPARVVLQPLARRLATDEVVLPPPHGEVRQQQQVLLLGRPLAVHARHVGAASGGDLGARRLRLQRLVDRGAL